MCAYNKGEYGVIRAIRKGNTRNYLELVRKKLLPAETINYVPKIAAAREIYRNSQSYGFKSNHLPSSMELPVMAKFNRKVDLLELSKKMNIPYKELRQLNPDIKVQSVTGKGSLSIVIPKNKKALLQKIAQGSSELQDKSKLTVYVVQSGDTLHAIARRFGIGVNELLKINRIKNDKIRPNQELQVPI